jgi:hypothetical protein
MKNQRFVFFIGTNVFMDNFAIISSVCKAKLYFLDKIIALKCIGSLILSKAMKKKLSKNNIIKQNSSLKKNRDDFIALTPTYGYILQGFHLGILSAGLQWVILFFFPQKFLTQHSLVWQAVR